MSSSDVYYSSPAYNSSPVYVGSVSPALSPSRPDPLDATTSDNDTWASLSNTPFTTAHPQLSRCFFIRRTDDPSEALQPDFDQLSFLPYLAVPPTVYEEEESEETPTGHMALLKRKLMKTKHKYSRPSSMHLSENLDPSPPSSPTTSSPLASSSSNRRELLRSLGGENLSMHTDLKTKGTRQAQALANALQGSPLAALPPCSSLPIDCAGSSVRMKINVSSGEHHSVRVSDTDSVAWVISQLPLSATGRYTSPTLWLSVSWTSAPFSVVSPLSSASSLFTAINRIAKSPPTCFASFSPSPSPAAAAAASSLDGRPASKSAAPIRSTPHRPQFPRSSSAHTGNAKITKSTNVSSPSSSPSPSPSQSSSQQGHSFQLYLLEAPGVHSSLTMQLSTLGFLSEHVMSKERVPVDDAIKERLKSSDGVKELMSREILLVALVQATTGLTRPLTSAGSHSHSIRSSSRRRQEAGAVSAVARLLARLACSHPLRTYLSTETLLSGHVPSVLCFMWDLLYLYVTKLHAGTELDTFEQLLQWCAQSTDQVPITDFKNSFANGLAVAALLSSFNSTLFPATQWSACDPFTAVTESLELFHARLGVPPILEPSHWAPPSNVDSAAIALYLYFVRARLLPLQQRVASCTEFDANGLRYLRIRFDDFGPYKLKTLKNLHPATTSADVKRLLARDDYPELKYGGDKYPRISTESFDLCIFKQGQCCVLPDLDVVDLNIKEVVAKRRTVASRRELLLSRSAAIVDCKQQEQNPELHPKQEPNPTPEQDSVLSLSAPDCALPSAEPEPSLPLPPAMSSNSTPELSAEPPEPILPRSRSPRVSAGSGEKRRSGFFSGFHRV